MKKLWICVLCLFMIGSNFTFANDSDILQEKLQEIWLSPEKDAQVLEQLYQDNEKQKQSDIAHFLIMPGSFRTKLHVSPDDEVMKQQMEEKYTVDKNTIIRNYHIENWNYIKEYADQKVLRYLISDNYYPLLKIGDSYVIYEPNRTSIDYNNGKTYFMTDLLKDEGIEFLKNKEAISNTFKNINSQQIKCIKFLEVGFYSSCLYIDCGKEEYFVRINIDQEGTYLGNGGTMHTPWLPELELYKLYTASEFMQIISDEENVMNAEKPIYEAEAEALQSEGLLYGNENGLDLLKPLTRIEATAMLVRALGFENEPTSEESYFSDIEKGSWGVKYANIAHDRGIAAGVGDNEFAPNTPITSSQFAALLLRNQGENPDWQTAINTLVERSYITSEQADKMDLFTRGDMAKLIYEAKNRD